MRYDLHCHTLHSDGEKSVSELFDLAKAANLSGLSITDHDTISAYREALDLAKEKSLEIVSGIEISCLFDDKPVHILAYSFSLRDPKFNEFLGNCQKLRYERNVAMLKLFAKENIEISFEEMEERFEKKMHAIGRPHFAKLLIEKNVVQTFSDAFNHYLGDGKKCFVLGHRPSVEEAIGAVHRAHGFAIIAHPHILHDSALEKKLLEMNFDGLEGYYAKMTPNREQKWVAIANNKNWIVTGGSDYHGESKSINQLGSSWVAKDVFDQLRKRYNDNESL